MRQKSIITAPFVAALCAALVGCGQAPEPSVPAAPVEAPREPAASNAPGVTDPLEIIEARRLLMAEAERQIGPIDLYTLGRHMDPAAIRTAALSIETVLIALPHLFPQSTNLFDPSIRDSPTIALPAVWESWGSFAQMAVHAERAAAALATAEGDAALMSAAKDLRASCDACHRAFTKPYVPPQVTEEDRNFDFERFLPPQ